MSYEEGDNVLLIVYKMLQEECYIYTQANTKRDK